MSVQERLDERYGRRRSRRARLAWSIAGGVVALGAVGGLAWTTLSHAVAAVDVSTTAFRFVSDHGVEVGFQVTVPAGASFACALEAQDVEHGIVGWRVVQYPPLDSHSAALTETVPTVAEATTGLVNSCWVT